VHILTIAFWRWRLQAKQIAIGHCLTCISGNMTTVAALHLDLWTEMMTWVIIMKQRTAVFRSAIDRQTAMHLSHNSPTCCSPSQTLHVLSVDPATKINQETAQEKAAILLFLKYSSRFCISYRYGLHNDFSLARRSYCNSISVKLGHLDVTVQEKLRSGWPGTFLKVEECCE
jgi:hypothetical protein